MSFLITEIRVDQAIKGPQILRQIVRDRLVTHQHLYRLQATRDGGTFGLRSGQEWMRKRGEGTSVSTSWTELLAMGFRYD